MLLSNENNLMLLQLMDDKEVKIRFGHSYAVCKVELRTDYWWDSFYRKLKESKMEVPVYPRSVLGHEYEKIVFDKYQLFKKNKHVCTIGKETCTDGFQLKGNHIYYYVWWPGVGKLQSLDSNLYNRAMRVCTEQQEEENRVKIEKESQPANSMIAKVLSDSLRHTM